MRLSELHKREDFDAILAATLERGWGQQYGQPVQVSTSPKPGVAQVWLIDNLWFRAEELSAQAMRQSSDGLRHWLREVSKIDWTR